MTLAELKSLVKKGEGRYLEFKKKADHPDKIVREMVAFANSGGGILLLGVDDSGLLSGLRYPDEEKFVMEAAIAKYARPSIPFQLSSIPVGQGLFVLLYKIENGSEKPYFWLSDKEKQTFRAFVRSADQSIMASREMFQVLKWEKNKISESAQPFRLNETEKKMLAHFGEHPSLSMKELMQFGNMSARKASRLLLTWVRQGVLRIEAGPSEDAYHLAPGFLPSGD